MNEVVTLEEASRLLFQEANALDQQAWDEWVDMYTEDAVFWVPTWRDTYETTENPLKELSLIYCPNRAGLRDRLARIRSGLSSASRLIPRTVHQITNIVVREDGTVRSAFTVHHWDLKSLEAKSFFGFYQHCLRRTVGGLKIKQKKIILKNDLIPTLIDFYSL